MRRTNLSAVQINLWDTKFKQDLNVLQTSAGCYN
jgi:hypothetical protein